jgi:very-short-patch-repair endonuclease
MDTTRRRALMERAATQHGIFTTAQTVELGIDDRQLTALLRSGVIERRGRGLWRVTGAPPTAEAAALGAVLAHGEGALLARSSAAWLWDVPGHQLGDPHVLQPRDVHLPEGATPHTSRSLGTADATLRRGIPVTTPTRTLFDLAGDQHPLRTRRNMNDLMARGLVTPASLADALDRLARRGRPGIALMRRLIEEASEKAAPAGSGLELRVEEILEAAGFRGIDRQVPLYDSLGFIARVDFGHRRRRIAIEVDSERFHGGLVDRMVDEAKATRIEAIDWLLVRITERQVWHERRELTASLREVLRSTRDRVA